MAPADDLQSKASDFIKKVLTVGVGAIFLTEESLKGLVGEIKLPKELLGGILESAGKTKREFLDSLSTEVLAKLTDRVDPRALLDELVTRYDVEFKIKMSLSPKAKSKNKKDKDEEE